MRTIILFASDLDNTLIHSYKKADSNDICVEYKDEKALSYMTPYAYKLLEKLNNRMDIVFAPLTTRSSEQYERIKLFKDTVPELALSANGGILYENGKKSQNWFNESKDLISDCYSEFEKGMDYFRDDDYVCFEIRLVDELFVFTRSSAPLTTKIVLESILDLSKVGVYNVGEKMYIFPNILTKGRAVRRLKENFSFEEVICAGDSEFDISMLNTADCALCPEQLKEYIRSENCISFDTEKQNFAEQILNYVLTERRGNI